jgi:hypothetical protein
LLLTGGSGFIRTKVIKERPEQSYNTARENKPMKKLRNLIGILAIMGIAAVLTGCGGDDDNNDDNNNNPPPTQFGPQTEAQLMAPDAVYTVNIAGQDQPITLQFPSQGNFTLTQGGVTTAGTITGLTHAGNTWSGTLTPTAGQGESGTVQLTFTSNNAGTYTITPNGGATSTGTFTVTTGQTDGGTNGGTDGTTNGNTDNGNTTSGNTTSGNTDSGGTGFTSNDLTGKTVQLTYENGHGERFDFKSASTASYEPASANINSTYTYSTQNGELNIVRADGATYSMTIPANQGTGSTSVHYHDSQTDETDPATFTITQTP